MTLWQKQVSPAWLEKNQPELEELAGADLAIIARPGRTRSLVQVTCEGRALAAQLQRIYGGQAKTLPRNWWKLMQAMPHAPVRVGRRLEIVSEPSAAAADGRHQLIIPAADAFGTGEHSTTAMSLRLVEETTRNWARGWRLLDAGTGTGILALAARRLGAIEALGLDNDPRAVANARQNARLNRVTCATFRIGDVLQWKSPVRYEIITANLFSELLIAALPIFKRALRAQGHLIISGILREQSIGVVRASRRAGFQIEKQRRRGKWVALLCSRACSFSSGPTVSTNKTQLKPR